MVKMFKHGMHSQDSEEGYNESIWAQPCVYVWQENQGYKVFCKHHDRLQQLALVIKWLWRRNPFWWCWVRVRNRIWSGQLESWGQQASSILTSVRCQYCSLTHFTTNCFGKSKTNSKCANTTCEIYTTKDKFDWTSQH